MRHVAAEDNDETDSTRMVITYGRSLSAGSRFDGYVLERYVRRVEWFDRKELHERAMQDPRKAEEVYDTDLRRFLFGEGINMPFSRAKSASGRPLSLPSDEDPKLWPPRITVAGTRIYLIAVRALPPVASASKLGKPAPVIITRDNLVDPDATDDESA
jgi:hypothetical protein